MKGKIIFQYEFQLAISVISISLLLSPLWIFAIKRLNSYLAFQKKQKDSKMATFRKIQKNDLGEKTKEAS